MCTYVTPTYQLNKTSLFNEGFNSHHEKLPSARSTFPPYTFTNYQVFVKSMQVFSTRLKCLGSQSTPISLSQTSFICFHIPHFQSVYDKRCSELWVRSNWSMTIPLYMFTDTSCAFSMHVHWYKLCFLYACSLIHVHWYALCFLYTCSLIHVVLSLCMFTDTCCAFSMHVHWYKLCFLYTCSLIRVVLSLCMFTDTSCAFSVHVHWYELCFYATCKTHPRYI